MLNPLLFYIELFYRSFIKLNMTSIFNRLFPHLFRTPSSSGWFQITFLVPLATLRACNLFPDQCFTTNRCPSQNAPRCAVTTITKHSSRRNSISGSLHNPARKKSRWQNSYLITTLPNLHVLKYEALYPISSWMNLCVLWKLKIKARVWSDEL